MTSFDWDPGSARIMYGLRGPEGAVHFVYSDWLPDAPDEVRKIDTTFMIQFGHPLMPMGIDVGYHAPAPMHEYHVEFGEAEQTCWWLDGAPCWADGSSTRARTICAEWLARGRDMDWLFDYLAGYYRATFRSNGQDAEPGFMEMVGTVLGLTGEELGDLGLDEEEES